MQPEIAIVGMACRYPDAQSPMELWENVLAQRQAFRQFPPERLRLQDYFSKDRTIPDMTYSTQGAFLRTMNSIEHTSIFQARPIVPATSSTGWHWMSHLRLYRMPASTMQMIFPLMQQELSSETP